jgi:transcriptional regulator with XRE-family HTH domain
MAVRREPEGDAPSAAHEHARRFGALIRQRREALKMRQDDLALATGVGRRFILELEGGKPSCQLGKALVVAIAVGIHPFELAAGADTGEAGNALLPDLDEPAP